MAPEAKIFAIEPNPSAFQVLKRNVETNELENVVVLDRAIWSKTGNVPFEIVKGHTTVGGLKVHKRYRNKGRLYRIVVPSITLEEICEQYRIKNIDLLKMDVEGSELEILKSSKYILPNIRKVVVEYHGNEKSVKEFMVKNDFRIVATEKVNYYGDIYFIRT